MKYLHLTVLGCFCVLASYAYGTTARPAHTVRQAPTFELDMDPKAKTQGGYEQRQRSAVVKLWTRVERDLSKREAAQVLAQVYGVTIENMNAYERWWK